MHECILHVDGCAFSHTCSPYISPIAILVSKSHHHLDFDYCFDQLNINRYLNLIQKRSDFSEANHSLPILCSFSIAICHWFTTYEGKVYHLSTGPHIGATLLSYRYAKYEHWFNVPNVNTPSVIRISTKLVQYDMVCPIPTGSV